MSHKGFVDDPTLQGTSAGWAGRECYELLGTSFEIWSSTVETSAMLEHLLAPFAVSGRPVPPVRQFFVLGPDRHGLHALYRGQRLIGTSGSSTSLATRLLSEVNRDAIEHFAGFAVHAGVVSESGRAIAFPAPSGHGKSTVVAACMSMGMAYVSDEALCFDSSSFAVLPYPKPLRLSSAVFGDRDLGSKSAIDDEVNVAAADLGAQIAPPPLDIAHIVRLVRRPGPDVIREVNPADAAAWLLRLSFNHYKQPGQSFALVTEVARRIRAWTLEYEEAYPAASLLSERLRGN